MTVEEEEHIEDPIQFCFDVILKEAKLEDRLVKQIFYHMLSAYTNNPLNLAINSPSGEGKNYVLRKVAENFPKEDVMFLTAMSEKALFHRQGTLVMKNDVGEYEPIEDRLEQIDSEIEDKEYEMRFNAHIRNDQKALLKSQIKTLEDEKKDLLKDAKKLIDLSHKILIFLDTPGFRLFDALMSLLSHDNYEVEYEYADATNTGIKTRSNVLRGWPVMIFAQALDFTHYQRYPEIKRRFNITNPKMDKDKYKAAIALIGKKFSYPNYMYESLVVSKSDKEKVREIIRGLKENILNVCDAVEPGNNNVIVPFEEVIINALRSDKAHDMTVAYRLFSYLSLLPVINLEKRPRIVFRKKGDPIAQIMPFATYGDLREAMFLMEHADGVRPYILEWYENVFLKTFREKTEPDSKLFKKDDLRTEDRIALTTQELGEATKEIQDKTLTVKKILQTYLEPLMNEGYIDKQESNINHRNNIYYPLVLHSQSYSLFQIFSDQKRNMEQKNSRQDLVNFTHELTPDYIKARIEKVVSCSSGPDIFCEIFDSGQNSITLNELVEKYYPSISRDRNAENGTLSEEQETEQELNSVRQMEQYYVHSEGKIQEKEQGTSNSSLEGYSCYYCDYETKDMGEYEKHVVIAHHRSAYPNKAEIEKWGLKPQGMNWEK
jgi:hypothetical protein